MVRVSVIVPAYNVERELEPTVASLLAQTLPAKQLEVIIVDDGSTDGTGAVADRLAARYADVQVVHQQNRGVSAARSAGIAAASGTYLAFVDAGDMLLPGTLQPAADLLADHGDEIDLVCYPMLVVKNGHQKPHVREEVLTHTGIYDLTKFGSAFAQVTNVNVLVRNTADLPRFREDLQVHEDLVFNLEVLLRRQKMGFSKAGGYVYIREEDSAGRTKMAPEFQFEQNTGFWEELFGRYVDAGVQVPLYLQASYMSELVWKIKADLLFPRHLSVREEEAGRARLEHLLDHVDDDVIWCAPRSDEYLRHFFYSLKHGTRTHASIDEQGFALWDDDKLLLCRHYVNVCLDPHFKGVADGIVGTLESVAFSHLPPWDDSQLSEPVSCTCVLADGTRKALTVHPIVSLPSDERSQRGVVGNECIANFYQFELPLRPSQLAGITFEVSINDVPFPVQVQVLPKEHGAAWKQLRDTKRRVGHWANRSHYHRSFKLPNESR